MMVSLEDLSELEFSNDRDPRKMERIVEGTHHDIILRPDSQSLGANENLARTIWNPDENVYIADHHSKAVIPWAIAGEEWYSKDEVLTLHLDMHRDDEPIMLGNKVNSSYEQKDWNGLVHYSGISEVMTVAQELGITDEIHYWGCPDSGEIRELNNSLEYLRPDLEAFDSVILDVDLDLFKGLDEDPPVGTIEIEDYYSAISELEEDADLTTYATSPGFIDQKEAIGHLRSIRDY